MTEKSREDDRLVELLATLRPLVTSEEGRTSALNTRALGVLQALAVVTAVSGFFGKDVVTQGFLNADKKPIHADLGFWTGKLVTVASVGILVVLLALLATTALAMAALYPHRRAFFGVRILERWTAVSAEDALDPTKELNRDVSAIPPLGELPESVADIRRRAVYELAGTYSSLRVFNDSKMKRLRRAYLALGIAIALTIAFAGVLAIEAAFVRG